MCLPIANFNERQLCALVFHLTEINPEPTNQTFLIRRSHEIFYYLSVRSDHVYGHFLNRVGHGPGAPTIAGCPIFPADNVWNTPIDQLPVDSNSSVYIATIGATTGLHPDFGTIWEGAPIGIPYNIVPGTQPQVSITFDYFDESDPGPYPIPPDADIEGGNESSGDRHILVLDEDNCILYETFYSWPQADGSW